MGDELICRMEQCCDKRPTFILSWHSAANWFVGKTIFFMKIVILPLDGRNQVYARMRTNNKAPMTWVLGIHTSPRLRTTGKPQDDKILSYFVLVVDGGIYYQNKNFCHSCAGRSGAMKFLRPYPCLRRDDKGGGRDDRFLQNLLWCEPSPSC